MKGNPMKRNFGKYIPKYKVELKGIDNNDTQKNLKDGKAPSSALQYHDDTKKDSEGWKTSHWPDGTERSAREIFEYEQSMDEERRDNERQQAVTRKPDPMMKAKSPMKATYAEAIKKDPKLADYVAKRKTLEKGSNAWNVNQNKINAAYGVEKRYSVATEDKPTPKPVVEKRQTITGGIRTKTETEGGHRRGGDTEIVREDQKGRKRRVVTKVQDKKTVKRYDKEGNLIKEKSKKKDYRQKKEKSPAKNIGEKIKDMPKGAKIGLGLGAAALGLAALAKRKKKKKQEEEEKKEEDRDRMMSMMKKRGKKSPAKKSGKGIASHLGKMAGGTRLKTYRKIKETVPETYKKKKIGEKKVITTSPDIKTKKAVLTDKHGRKIN